MNKKTPIPTPRKTKASAARAAKADLPDPLDNRIVWRPGFGMKLTTEPVYVLSAKGRALVRGANQ